MAGNQLEVSKRIKQVKEWILEDRDHKDIVEDIVSSWNIGDRMARKYIRWGMDALVEKDEFSINIKKAYYLKRKLKLIRDIDPKERKTARGVRAINAVLDSMAEIEGLKVSRHELTGKDGVPIQVDTSNKTIFILPDNGRDGDGENTES